MRIKEDWLNIWIPASQILTNSKQASNSGKQQISTGIESMVTHGKYS